jgi:hypothetical protein
MEVVQPHFAHLWSFRQISFDQAKRRVRERLRKE